jgi:predicted nucleic acid-binding protein
MLDTSIVVAGERRGWTISQFLDDIHIRYNEAEVGLSVVTIVELTHGVFRAKHIGQQQRRQAFVDALAAYLPVYPVTLQIARLAGRIQGQQAQRGVNIPFEDLLIAATAIDLGFGVATANVRHFELVPDLRVVTE